MAFIPDNAKPDVNRESDAITTQGAKLSRQIKKNQDRVILLSKVNVSYV
jgi:hypothetical protein